MSQSLTQVVQKQVGDAVVAALKQASQFFWLRSQTAANPYIVRLS